MPKLKLFNAPAIKCAHTHNYVAARSRKRAAEIADTTEHDIKNYWSKGWGPKATEVIGQPTQEGMWQICYGHFRQLFPKA